MAWGAFGASNPNPAFAGAQSSGRGASSSNARIRRLAVLGTAAGLASGLGIQRRAAHAKMGGSSEKQQGKQTIGAFTHAMAGAFAGGCLLPGDPLRARHVAGGFLEDAVLVTVRDDGPGMAPGRPEQAAQT